MPITRRKSQPQPKEAKKAEKIKKAEGVERVEKVEKPSRPERVLQNTPPVITKAELLSLQRAHGTKSAIIRALAADGHRINMIAHTLLLYGVLSPRSAYQHVRNVLNSPLKRK